jgi:hypothetical protein
VISQPLKVSIYSWVGDFFTSGWVLCGSIPLHYFLQAGELSIKQEQLAADMRSLFGRGKQADYSHEKVFEVSESRFTVHCFDR